ncbi:MAG: DNA cytosine methyltransferase, partial [Vicinamibacterales bacterium]
GLPEPVLTDIPRDAKTGRPRGFFRKRSWVRQFFQVHGLRAGDTIAIERVEDYRYVIRPEFPEAEFTVAEFFAGIGLVRLALEHRGFRVVFANDIDPQKFAMYRDNFGADDFALGDIHRLDADRIPDCDLYTASFPCNDLSIAGAMAGLNGSQSSAFWGLVRILREKAKRKRLPSLVLLENVPGFLIAHGGKDFEAALLALCELNYACDALIIDAVHFVPQSRARLFVIAQLGVEGRFPFGIDASTVRTQALVAFMMTHPHIRWSVRHLPSPPSRGPLLPTILEDLADNDPAWWNEERTGYFMNQLSQRHAKVAARMIAGNRYTYATAFRRVRHGRSMAELRTDGIAGCLRTPRGGSGRQILFQAGRAKRRVRLLT